MQISLVLLLLSSSLSLCGTAAIPENGLPLVWVHTTSVPTNFEVVDGHLSPDPWDFVKRMNLYNVLITHTNKYMGPMGAGDTESPLWGLPLQYDWMFTSGRLADPTDGLCGKQHQEDVPDTCVSPLSWYSCVNYFGSVLPYLSAVHQGLMGDGLLPVQMRAAEGFCVTYEGCKADYDSVMTKWDTFFQSLKDENLQLSDLEKKDFLLGQYWDANMASTHASKYCDTRLDSYNAMERAFAVSWRNAAEYVAALYFQSSLRMASVFMKPLPGRMLQTDDVVGSIPDLSMEENQVVKAFSWMYTADTTSFGATQALWRRLMCSAEARQNGRDLLYDVMTNSTYTITSFANVLNSMSGCN